MRTNLARGTLLAVMWLNMAITPCAMAFESDDHDCPHCPPAEEHAMAGHHGHGEVERSCDTMQSDCCDLAEAVVEEGSALPATTLRHVRMSEEQAAAVDADMEKWRYGDEKDKDASDKARDGKAKQPKKASKTATATA